jgi:hypothetical protein
VLLAHDGRAAHVQVTQPLRAVTHDRQFRTVQVN